MHVHTHLLSPAQGWGHDTSTSFLIKQPSTDTVQLGVCYCKINFHIIFAGPRMCTPSFLDFSNQVLTKLTRTKKLSVPSVIVSFHMIQLNTHTLRGGQKPCQAQHARLAQWLSTCTDEEIPCLCLPATDAKTELNTSTAWGRSHCPSEPRRHTGSVGSQRPASSPSENPTPTEEQLLSVLLLCTMLQGW